MYVRKKLYIRGATEKYGGIVVCIGYGEREPIMGSGGFAPSGAQGQSLWSGNRPSSPPEAERNLAIHGSIFAEF